MILLLLISFLSLTFLYHILTTIIGFWVFDWSFPQIPAILRDGLWFFLFILSLVISWKQIPSYRKKWKNLRLSFVFLCFFSFLISRIKDKSFYDMFVWFKYGFQYISIFLMATFIWWTIHKQHLSDRLHTFFSKLPIWLSILVGIGFLWQWLKIIFPNLFLSIGYWPLDDFHFWANPPLYYLTGLNGTLRRQGIFAGPNNYGYFLVAFLPLILTAFPLTKKTRLSRYKKEHILPISITLLWFMAIAATLSRTALIGVVVVIFLYQYKRFISHKKQAIFIWILLLLSIAWLSLLKWSSTLAHIHAKLSSISYVFEHPGWYWLGSSWPAVHHNWTILPENYFIQIIIDIWRIGFWLLIITMIYGMRQYTSLCKQSSFLESDALMLLRSFWIGFVALLAMGLTLHVFEDSMVNYSFFICRWLYRWYLEWYKTKKLKKTK